jgi:predicted permease
MIIEASMPSAIFLSIIAKMDKFAELGLITQGIVFTHLISFITISIFLALI